MFSFVAGLFKGKAEEESGGVDAASPPLNPASTPALAAKVLGHEGCVKLTSNDALGASCALRRTSQATPDFATLEALTRGNAGRRPVVAHCALRRLVCFWRAARLRSGSVLFSTANGRGGGKMTEALHRLTQRRRYAACAAVTAPGADGAAPAAQRVKAEPVEGTLRTYETAFINKSVPELPTGFPTGPWATREDAKDAIAAFCRNPATAGGARTCATPAAAWARCTAAPATAAATRTAATVLFSLTCSRRGSTTTGAAPSAQARLAGAPLATRGRLRTRRAARSVRVSGAARTRRPRLAGLPSALRARVQRPSCGTASVCVACWLAQF